MTTNNKTNRDVLIIVDAQNDFITKALPNPEAQKAVPNIIKLIRDFNGEIICTQDTHDQYYMYTQEGKNLPIEHCIYKTEGWEIEPEIMAELKEKPNVKFIEKPTFGSKRLEKYLNEKTSRIQSITFCGFCTDICVIANVILAKTKLPEVPITVIANASAGVTPETHNAALTVMKSLQVEIDNI